MGHGEGHTVPLQSDAPEEGDLWTAWQLFPLDDDQTCHSKDWVGDWVGVELLYNSVKTRSQTVVVRDEMWEGKPRQAEGVLRAPDWLRDQRRRRQDVVGKATPGRRGPLDLRWSFGDKLVIRCCKEAIIQQRAGPLGLRLSSHEKRHNADSHMSQNIAVFVQSPTPSHSKTLSNLFRTLTIKVSGTYFGKEVFARLLFIASVCILHEHVYVLCVCIVDHSHGYWVAIQHGPDYGRPDKEIK